jgi:hypothetical protein
LNKTLSLNLSFGAGMVLSLIFQEAENCLNAPECINLENKVVLSIAIRLIAEDLMIRRINNPSITDQIKKDQTIELFNVFKELFSADKQAIALLGQVIMMTPETIHLNSFMYEPLIDLSDHYLKDLYRKVKAFSTPTSP